MSLDDLRNKVIFHNSIDIWIATCGEKNIPWKNVDGYKKFIAYLLKNNLNLKAFNLCAHEAGDTQLDKKEFAESLANLKANDPNAATYTIKLSDQAIELIRKFDLNRVITF